MTDKHRAVPTPNPNQCAAALHHLVTNAVFNISSDALILCVALPMFIKTRLPLRKKVAVVAIFSLGSFVILCAILNKYYSFTQPFGSEWTYWYVRESSTAILTANVPYVWALIRRVFSFRALDSTSGNRYTYTQSNLNDTRMRTQTKSAKAPTTQEIDMDHLIADSESQKEGIHREIHITVTEDDGHRSVNGGSGTTWTDDWAAPRYATMSAESGSGSNGVATVQPMQKAVLKDH